jgi:cobalt-zinc-cadmium efflux system protein
MHGHDHGSGHGHSHAHGHAHGHAHAPQNFQSAFAISVALNIALVVAQAMYGVIANSVALLADAGHNLSDVFGLLLAWGAATAAKKAPTERFTYGYRSTSILAALANAIILLIAVGAIALEAVRRFFYPEPVAAGGVMIASAIGVVINGGTALLFMRGRHGDINIRGAYLHLAADAGVSVGVLLSAFVIWQTGWMWIDPAVSLAIAGVIVAGTWGLLRDSVNMALQGVPPGIDPGAVRRHLEALPGVACIHDLHIWAMSTTESALTCHLVMPGGHPGDAFIARAGQDLHAGFGIQHVTLQIEYGDAESCALAPDNVV